MKTKKYILGVVAVAVLVVGGIMVYRYNPHGLSASVYNVPASWAAGCHTGHPGILVLSPNGGEIFAPGQQITIHYQSCNLPSGTTISGSLVWPASFGSTPIPHPFTNMPNTGLITFTLPGTGAFTSPNTFQYGNFYKVTLNAVDSSPTHVTIANDSSDNTFIIAAPAATTSCTPTVTRIPGFLPTALISQSSASGHQTATFRIPFRVTATAGCTIYIPATANNSVAVGGSVLPMVGYSVQNSTSLTAPTSASGPTTGALSGYNAANTTPSQTAVVLAGTSSDVTLTAAFTPSSAGQYRAFLGVIPYSSDINAARLGGYGTFLSLPVPSGYVTDFVTPYVTLQ